MSTFKNGKKILSLGFKAAVIVLALIGLYQVFYGYRWNAVRKEVERRDAVQKTYDKDFLYQVPDSEPLVLVNPAYRQTVFIIGGFRASHFLDYFKELHEKEKFNVVAPVAGLTGWPFRYRNREWFYQEDMRVFSQVYDAYTAGLPRGHRVVVLSMSFGALSNTIIGLRAKRKPDAQIYLSPLNSRLDYRAASPLMAWLSGKIHYLRHVAPFVIRTKNPKRAGMWDIVNDEKNRAAWESYGTRVVNWEENLGQAVRVREAARYLENELIPRMKGGRVLIMYGDDDLFFSREGFENLAASFAKAGNRVRTVMLPKTGHMVLNDNGAARAKDLIARTARGSIDW